MEQSQNHSEKYLESISGKQDIKELQKAATVLGTAPVLRQELM